MAPPANEELVCQELSLRSTSQRASTNTVPPARLSSGAVSYTSFFFCRPLLAAHSTESTVQEGIRTSACTLLAPAAHNDHFDLKGGYVWLEPYSRARSHQRGATRASIPIVSRPRCLGTRAQAAARLDLARNVTPVCDLPTDEWHVYVEAVDDTRGWCRCTACVLSGTRGRGCSDGMRGHFGWWLVTVTNSTPHPTSAPASSFATACACTFDWASVLRHRGAELGGGRFEHFDREREGQVVVQAWRGIGVDGGAWLSSRSVGLTSESPFLPLVSLSIYSPVYPFSGPSCHCRFLSLKRSSRCFFSVYCFFGCSTDVCCARLGRSVWGHPKGALRTGAPDTLAYGARCHWFSIP